MSEWTSRFAASEPEAGEPAKLVGESTELGRWLLRSISRYFTNSITRAYALWMRGSISVRFERGSGQRIDASLVTLWMRGSISVRSEAVADSEWILPPSPLRHARVHLNSYSDLVVELREQSPDPSLPPRHETCCADGFSNTRISGWSSSDTTISPWPSGLPVFAACCPRLTL